MYNNIIHEENDLLLKVASGDEMAFRQLFNTYWDNIYGVSFMLTKSEALAEDMVQEIFLKIWLKREQLPQIENFRNFLFIVARNHIFDTLRKKTKEKEFIHQLFSYFNPEPDSPEKKLLQKESGLLIQQAINNLPDQQRMVYQLARDKGLRQEEIAEQLGISRNTVRNHMARALQSLRDFLQNHSGGLLLFICLIELYLPE